MTIIFSYLQGSCLSNCAMTCRDWKDFLNDNFLWKQICLKKSYRPLHHRQQHT
ncbi:hypothetical protein HDU91_004971, partial [Kappamyces sp. JEL0680]